jgi:hypothetical protein
LTPVPAPRWLALAAIVGFAISAVFSWGLQWSRTLFLLPYVVLAGAFLFLYFRDRPLPPRRWIAHWPATALAVAAASFLLWRNIQGQPASATPAGGGLLFALGWTGLVYGTVDALLLNVVPVLAAGGPPADLPNASRGARLRQGVIGLAASLFVTAAYHAGYTEFQGSSMLLVLVGNTIITATYLVSGNPLAAVATHVIMHTMAVLHGMETTLQLPPHYGI